MTEPNDRPLRLAIAGMGLRGVSMTGSLLEWFADVEIVALADKIRARAELTRDHYGLGAGVFDDVAACLDEVQPDALAVFTPDAFHADAAIPALQRDVHVYCEKPMATTLAGCDDIIAAAEASGAVFYMGHNMRMSPLYHTVREIVAGGEVGELLTLEMNEYYYGGRTYFRRWNRLLRVGGGLWITKTVHDFDMMCWLMQDEPVSVYAVGGRKHFRPKPGAAERCRDCPLKWDCDDYQPPETIQVGEQAGEEGKLRFWDEWQRLGRDDGYLPADACLYRDDIETIEYGIATVRFAGGSCATHTMNVVTTPPAGGRWLVAVGTKGTVRTDPKARRVDVSFRDGRAARAYDVGALVRGSHGGADRRVMTSFVRCCRGEGEPIAGWADGRRAVALGLAATRSMAEGAVAAVE